MGQKYTVQQKGGVREREREKVVSVRVIEEEDKYVRSITPNSCSINDNIIVRIVSLSHFPSCR